ncbi:MAG: hypothetical protein E7253_02630 [Lachnospiraceae bacterium]|nr:hypothetical protein [Lachnospiraceae bacterium]
MDKKIIQINHEIELLRAQLTAAEATYQSTKEELENFLSQFTCVLDAPSCGCSEEELNDPKFEALYTEQDRLTKLSKASRLKVKELKERISALEEELGQNL